MFPDGICRVEGKFYSKTIQFQDINYQLSQNEDKDAIFDGWCDFLNYFDASVRFQFSFVNSAANKETYRDRITIPLRGDEDDSLRAGWMQGIGYVPQSPFLLNGSLAENIAFSQWGQEINRQRVKECCHMAAMDFLGDLDEGLDTIIGERGVRLSGGQLQRVSIARALYSRPQLIIFDEATSALDGATEQAIQDTIENLRKYTTVVIIAHRMSAVEKCDWLYWVERGKVHMAGTARKILHEYQHLFSEGCELY